MAQARLITSDIWQDDWFGTLSFFEQALWIGLFSTCADDQGRMLDNPVLIRASVFPYKDVPISEIAAALASFEQAGRIHRYQTDGKGLLQLVNWWDHQHPQWAQPSKWAAPEGWRDCIRANDKTGYVESNWKDRASRGFPAGHIGGRATLSTQVALQDYDYTQEQDYAEDRYAGADAPDAPAEPLPFDDPPEEAPEPAPKRRAAPKPRDTRSNHPAIRAVREVMQRYPPKATYDGIIAACGNAPDVGRLRACYQEWAERGYNPASVKWATEWYAQGGPPSRAAPRANGNGYNSVQANIDATQAMLRERMAEVLAERGEHG